MNIQKRIEAFSKLGNILRAYSNEDLLNTNPSLYDSFEFTVKKANAANGWFTIDNVKYAIMSLGKMLKNDNLNKWIERYESDFCLGNNARKIGVIMAGNIPAVGFHDLLCVLISGNKILIKSSSADDHLIRFIADLLIEIEPEFEKYIQFAGDKLKDFDAIIATGSNNTSRYFEHYFGKFPNIIRKNMNAVALLNGNETNADIEGLAEDVFRYFGMGCRNVSAILAPNDYDMERITSGFQSWEQIIDHNKYYNNYVYYKTLSTLNIEQYYDGGFYIMKASESIPGPLSVINIISYNSLDDAKNFIEDHLQEIQCVASIESSVKKHVKPGQTQNPELWDYADEIDTMKFLISL